MWSHSGVAKATRSPAMTRPHLVQPSAPGPRPVAGPPVLWVPLTCAPQSSLGAVPRAPSLASPSRPLSFVSALCGVTSPGTSSASPVLSSGVFCLLTVWFCLQNASRQEESIPLDHHRLGFLGPPSRQPCPQDVERLSSFPGQLTPTLSPPKWTCVCPLGDDPDPSDPSLE